MQLPGINFINALTILAAVGTIERFPDAKHLVGYSGLYPAVKESGKSRWRGRITKSGRRDLRRAMVEAAISASRFHPHWKGEMERLEPRIGKQKALVAVARKLLVAIWHILMEQAADRFTVPEKVALSIFSFTYKVGVSNLPGGQNAREYTRAQLDRLGIGQELEYIPWRTKRPKLPPSRLKQ